VIDLENKSPRPAPALFIVPSELPLESSNCRTVSNPELRPLVEMVNVFVPAGATRRNQSMSPAGDIAPPVKLPL
jgi:hypothetical protein